MIAFDSLVGNGLNIAVGSGAPYTMYPQEFTAQELVRIVRIARRWKATVSGTFLFEISGVNYTSTFSADFEMSATGYPSMEGKMACPFTPTCNGFQAEAGTWSSIPDDEEEEPVDGTVSIGAFLSILEGSNLPELELPYYKFDATSGNYWPVLRSNIQINFNYPLSTGGTIEINFAPAAGEPPAEITIDTFTIPGTFTMEGTLSVSAEIKPIEFWGYDPGDGGGPVWNTTTGSMLRPNF